MLLRNARGRLPAFTDVGGYPLYYICADGGNLCPQCANGDNGSLATVGNNTDTDKDTDKDMDSSDRQWRVVACEVHWEGPPLQCDHCYTLIGSAYGQPDSEGNYTDPSLDE